MRKDICSVIAGLQQNAETMRAHIESGAPTLDDLVWYWPASGLSCRYVGDTCEVVACHPADGTAAERGDVPPINGARIQGILYNRGDAIRLTLGMIRGILDHLQAQQ